MIYSASDLVAEPEKCPDTFKVNRRGVTRIPQGWTPQTIENNQPPPQYKEFRHERTRDVGRPAAMPQLAVQMDASGHNYSSARFDDRGYWRANDRIRRMMEIKRINPYTDRVLREGEALKLIRRRRGKIKLTWQWSQAESIDPEKDAKARAQRLKNMTTSPIRACREESVEFEQICKEFAEARDVLERYNLPLELAEKF